MLRVAALAVMLRILLTTTALNAQKYFTDPDLPILNATLEEAKAKLSSTYYFLDDPSPGDYFDNIATATKMLMKVLSEGWTWNDKRRPFISLFKEISSKTDAQAAPFGERECSLLPKEFRPCAVEPTTGGTLRVLTSKLELGITYDSPAVNVADLVANLRTVCETLDGRLKTSEAFVGERCEEGLSDEDSEEQAIKRKLFLYAKENGFEGNESSCLHLFVARYTKSPEAVQKFKSSFDKHFVAWVTMQAFCMVVMPAPSDDECRARVVKAHASFSRSLSRTEGIQTDKSQSWACEDEKSASEMSASFESLDVSRLVAIVEDARRKIRNTMRRIFSLTPLQSATTSTISRQQRVFSKAL